MRPRSLVLCVLLCATFSLGAADTSSQRAEYDPFLAGALSWYAAGLGQLYTENYARGVLFFGIDTTLLVLTIDSIVDLSLQIDRQFGIDLNMRLKDRKSMEFNSFNATFFLITYISFHFYNVFDAITTASRKNLGLSFNLNPADETIRVSLSRRF